MSVKYQTKLKARCAFVLCIILACFIGPHPVLALSKKYAEQGPYGVGSKKVTIARTGVGFFDATVYFPTAASAGGRCTNVATCYLQSMATSQNQELAAGKFPLVAFGLNTFISGQEVYGSTMRHIASHGFIVCATNSRYIQPAAESVEMVDCINWLERQNGKAGSQFHRKINIDAGVGVLGYSQGGAASLDAAALLGDRCAGCISQHAQPSMSVRRIKCPVFLHSGDADSLTGIMRAMIWPGATTPKVFAVMRGAHHLTPVPPSPWDPWSVAWLLLYQKGDMEAGSFIWGKRPGSLRAESSPVGKMSYVLFNPDVPWSMPYSQYGIVNPGQFTLVNEKSVNDAEAFQYENQQPPSVAPPAPAAAPTSPYSMWPGFDMFSGQGGGGSSSPYSGLFGGGGLSSLLQRFAPPVPAPAPVPAQTSGTAGMENTLSNTAGSLSGVYNLPVDKSKANSPGAYAIPPQPLPPPPSQSIFVDQANGRLSPSTSAQNSRPPVTRPVQPNFPPQRPTTSRNYGPYCNRDFDCCLPGRCTEVRGSIRNTRMCSLPAGGLGKLSTDASCRNRPRDAQPERTPSPSPNNQKFALVSQPKLPSPSLQNNNGDNSSPTIKLVSCDAAMILQLENGTPNSKVIVIGSIYEPKYTEQLSLLSNSQCPVIDIKIKLPKQHMKSFLKYESVRTDALGSASVVFDNENEDSCTDYIYQAIDISQCSTGPILDLRD